jgi:hypothetical protein
LPAVARLERFQIVFVVAVITKIVAVMTPVTHDDVRVFLGNDEIVFVVKSQCRWLILLVTGVTIEIRKVCFCRDELAIRNSGGRIARNRTVH